MYAGKVMISPAKTFQEVPLLIGTVRRSGAVSPMILATPSKIAVTRPDLAAGRITWKKAL
jgi:hypothetical protein